MYPFRMSLDDRALTILCRTSTTSPPSLSASLSLLDATTGKLTASGAAALDAVSKGMSARRPGCGDPTGVPVGEPASPPPPSATPTL
mmetsp:Transcript_32002/g.95190  ORF Transcript_32002/g.95190 Transcript_32002/m.95190 type:complete len:87 (+) Transcript_32002:1022-1282(+)